MARHDTTKEQAAQLKRARIGLAWALLPKIPKLLGVVFRRLLGLSPRAQYMDLKTDLTLTVMKLAMGDTKPQPVGKTQAFTLLDPGVQGRIWISHAVAEVPPERGLRDALERVILSLCDGGPDPDPESVAAQSASLMMPDMVPVEAEWTGYRAGVPRDEPLPDVPEAQKYEAMMKECRNATTVLYFHGGAYYLCDPCTHRQLTKRMAKAMGGRVYSVRYRLAPQNPFPAALLDALVSYFTLLYPPPGSIHEPVSARDIVFGGDSAGGNLALALTQTLLQLRRQNIKPTWFGARRAVPLPAGITLLSPWADITRSMPSWTTNQVWDYLPRPEREETLVRPADEVWPASPARQHIFVADALRLHPLVSVHLNNNNLNNRGSSTISWAGAPPTWLAWGWECLADEDRYIAARLRADGVRVVLEEYEAMPHVFAAVVPRLPEAERCVQGWARFVAASRKDPGGITDRYTLIRARTLEEEEGDLDNLTTYTPEDVLELARSKVGRMAPLPAAAVAL
ncbi:alpha/beta hydrolase fold-domain-containing protein [Nemania sp. FL0916]|nr:alpha/beta hydrolase fold-domain-containing protein [Nemania sp. FL0916]